MMRRALRACTVAVIACSAGCTPHWRTVEVAPAALDAEPGQVRVTMADGSRIIVTSPRIENDSLFGARNGAPVDTIALPLVAISRIAIEEANKEKRSAVTLLLVTAAATFAGFIALVAASN